VLPGCEAIAGVADVPGEWVALYRAEILHHTAHLYEDEIKAYLNAQAPGWHAVARLHSNGDHWTVDLLRGGTHDWLTVTTRADGNCGAHAVHAVIHRAAVLADASLAHNHAADDALIGAIRSAAQHALTDATIRARILNEVHNAPNVFQTGFGPQLINAIQRRAPDYVPTAEPVDKALSKWGPGTDTTITGPLGLQLSARHNRGAPYLTAGPSSSTVSNPKDLESYESWIRVLRGAGIEEATLARYLGMKDPNDLIPLATVLKTPEQRFVLCMMWATVNLAEEFRKKGAAKVFRALMRAVEKNSTDLKTAVLTGFRFKTKADEGRVQVALVQDLLSGAGAPSYDAVKDANARPPRGVKLSQEQKRERDAIRRKAEPAQIKWAKTIVENISDGESDLSSDADAEKVRRLKSKKRKFSKPHEKDDK
jgi:hypothetical protein